MPHFMVEIVQTIKLESYWLCGAAPMKKLMVLLALPKFNEATQENAGVVQIYNYYEVFCSKINQCYFF